jgi:hypothetical protein
MEAIRQRDWLITRLDVRKMVELWKVHGLGRLKTDDEQLWNLATQHSRRTLNTHEEELTSWMERRAAGAEPSDSSRDSPVAEIVRMLNNTSYHWS